MGTRTLDLPDLGLSQWVMFGRCKFSGGWISEETCVPRKVQFLGDILVLNFD
jgi:hypothetical protein